MANTYKRFSFVYLGTLLCLSKYLFERKCNDILERCFENIYAIKNEDRELFTYVIQRVFIVLVH